MTWPYIDEITPHLFISDVYAAKHPATLQKHGITHILSLLSFASIGPVAPPLQNLNMNILDYEDENIIDEFAITNPFIANAVKNGGKVLVHCQAGISRSSTVLIAYLMSSAGLSREEAYEKVKGARKIVCPNPGFWEQLGVYQACECRPEKGKPAYDAWMKKFYAWGGPGDPGVSNKEEGGDNVGTERAKM